jgi:hypothetical protein
MGEQGDTISKELEESSIELIYEEIKWALEAQRESLSSVEGKATTLTGFSGAMLALLVGSLQDQVVGSGARICIVIAVGLSCWRSFTTKGGEKHNSKWPSIAWMPSSRTKSWSNEQQPCLG